MRWSHLIIFAALWAGALPARAESFAAWAAKAERLEKRGDDAGALGAYSQALALWRKKDGRPAKAKTLAARAALYEKSRAWEDAVKDLSAAADISTRTASYRYRAGRAALELGKASEAITWFYQATKLNLNYKEAYYDRARAYEQTGDLQFAREDYRTACKLGVKTACSRDKSLKTGQAPAAPPPDEFAPAAPVKPKGPVEVRRRIPRVAKASVKNFPACIDGLNQCVSDGGTFNDCVSQAPLCEKADKPGCCPEVCVKTFAKMMNAKSEAEAFRRVFVPNSDCLRPTGHAAVEEPPDNTNNNNNASSSESAPPADAPPPASP